MLLLHYDACATIINGTAEIPKEVTQNPEIRSMLEGESYMSRHSFIRPFGYVCVSLLTLSPGENLCFYCSAKHQLQREQRRGNRRRTCWKLHGKETFQL